MKVVRLLLILVVYSQEISSRRSKRTKYDVLHLEHLKFRRLHHRNAHTENPDSTTSAPRKRLPLHDGLSVRAGAEGIPIKVNWIPENYTLTSKPFNSCGVLATDEELIADRIIGGTEAKLGSWPWIAALGYKINNNEGLVNFKCGGTLVTQKHVVTAAHCVLNHPELYLVRLGELDLSTEDDHAKPRDIKIAKSKIHEDYSTETFENDVALLTLELKVTFTEHIRPACLPVSDDIQKQNFKDHSPKIAGWGATSFGGQSSAKLLELDVPVHDTSVCRTAYEDFGTVVDERQICAGYLTGGKDTCQGDSGGPLVWEYKGAYYLVGIVSYGYHCAEVGYPGVYARVTSYLDWIQNNIKSN